MFRLKCSTGQSAIAYLTENLTEFLGNFKRMWKGRPLGFFLGHMRALLHEKMHP